MKQGFQIEIQKDLSSELKAIAEKYADKFIQHTKENNGSWKDWSRGGWDRRLTRGVVGITIHDSNHRPDNALVFRRASKTRRIFQIVKRDLVIQPEHRSRCVCGKYGHSGGTKAIVKYGDIPCEIYYQTGFIKG